MCVQVCVSLCVAMVTDIHKEGLCMENCEIIFTSHLHSMCVCVCLHVCVRGCERETGLVKQCTVVNLIFVKQNILLPQREVMSLQGF